MMKKLLLVFCWFFLSPSVFAAPSLVNFQGLLTDINGVPLTGPVSITFKLFDAETEGTEQWSENQTVTVQNGHYHVLLGSTTAFQSDLFQTDTLWLEITVDGETLSPRKQLTSAPYAFQANQALQAQSVVDGAITSTSIAPGSITSTQLDASVVTLDQIAPTCPEGYALFNTASGWECQPAIIAQSGDIVTCYDAPLETLDQSVCQSGLRQFDGNTIGECVGAVLPSQDDCSGRDLDCNGLGYECSWASMGLLENLSPDGTSAANSQVAMDANGNAIITWQQSDGIYTQIFKAEYRNGSWITPSSLSDNISLSGNNGLDPQVAMDDNGNAIITWVQSDGTSNQIFKAEYRNGSWAVPSSLNDNISPDGENAYSPQVAMDDNGNAIITWRQLDGAANAQIFKAEYRNSSWTVPSTLSDNISPGGQHAYSPQVAMDDNGNAVITWHQDGEPYAQIFKAEYRNSSWAIPTSISDNISPDGQNAYIPQVAMDDNGNSVITWYQSDGTTSQIFKAEYRNSSWTVPASLSDNISLDGQIAQSPKVAMDGKGNDVIIWQQSNGINNQIFKAEYRSGSWTVPSSLNDNISLDGQNAYNPQVAMDDNGNSVITWYQSDGTNNQIFKAEYRNGSWTTPSSLSDNICPDGQSAGGPQVAMDDNGNAIITWHQSNGTFNQILTAEYRLGYWTHPSSLSDNISWDGENDYLPQAAIDDNGNAIITWHQSDGTSNQIFKAEYRNGSWTVPSSLNDNISPDGEYAFYPNVAMDDNGNAIITWAQSDGSYNQIFKAEYRNGSWTTPASLSDNISPNGQDAAGPKVAMDDNGNAIITWVQSDGSYNQIFKAEYRNGSWTYPSSLSDNISPDGNSVFAQQVAMDNNGSAVITWYQSDGANGQIFKAEYRNGSWTYPSSLSDNISPDGQNAAIPGVAMDDNGNAIITWEQSDGTDKQIFKAEYSNGSWTYPSSLNDNISPDGRWADNSQVAMDNNGNAIITWVQYDETNDEQIFKAEYRSGLWIVPSSLSDNISPDGRRSAFPRVAMDDNGNAVITWYQLDGTDSQTFKAEYRGGVWTVPTSLSDSISTEGQVALRPHVAMGNNGNAVITWYQRDGTSTQTFKSYFDSKQL